MNSRLKALSWIRNNSLNDECVVITSRQRIPYPEVTGYLIPTLYNMGERALALGYARWLISVQQADGSFLAPRGNRSLAFDTGQIIRGLVRALPDLPELEAPITRACDWLIRHATSDGRLPLPQEVAWWSLGERGVVNEAIHLYVLPAIRQAGEVLGSAKYVEFAFSSRDYYIKSQPIDSFRQFNMLSHFYLYIQEALVELDAPELAQKGMRSVAEVQQSDGSIPAYVDEPWICTPGQAQAAVVWYRLGEQQKADAALSHLQSLMNPSGGFYGSYGPKAGYFPEEEVSWACKYFLDASVYQIQRFFDQEQAAFPDQIATEDGRLKSLFEITGSLDGKKVLDAGCGKGRFLGALQQRFPMAELHGVDISAELLSHVPKGIKTARSSMLGMPFPDNTFDLVYCVEALEHAVAISQAVAEMSRVLRPGGLLVIIDKNAAHMKHVEKPAWEQWFIPEELAAVMRASCTGVSWKYIPYDTVAYPDGWFVAWIGAKASGVLTQKDSDVGPLDESKEEIGHLTKEMVRLIGEKVSSDIQVAKLQEELQTLRSHVVWRWVARYRRLQNRFPPLKTATRGARKIAKVGKKAAKKAVEKLRLPNDRISRLLPGLQDAPIGQPPSSSAPAPAGNMEGLHFDNTRLLGACPAVTDFVAGLVSIVLPVYNQADLLEAAIESVLAQTYQDFELIVVNDGSTDGVERMLDKYFQHPKVRLVTQVNQKLPGALNTGFEYANGEYYTWTSADNLLMPHQIETLVNHLRNHPEVSFVYSNYQAIDDQGRPLQDPTFRPQNQRMQDPSMLLLPEQVTVANLHESGDNFIGASFLYRRGAAWMVGPYAADAFGGEDYDFWLRLHSLFHFDHVKDILYLYRVHANTLNAKAVELKLAQNVSRVLERDKKRRQFLQSAFRFFQIGTRFALPETPNGVPIVVVRYQEAEREIKELTASWSNVLLIAYVDEPITRVDTKILERFDLIVTPSPEVFRFLSSGFKTRVVIMDPSRDPELFHRLATYRSFEKQCAVSEQKISYSLYQPRKMKMAVLVNRMEQGGLEEVVVSLVKNIDKTRYQVSILIPESDPGKMGQHLQQQGFEVHCFDLKEEQFERHLRKNPVDVVHIHHTTFGFEVLQSLGIPYVFTIHNSYTWFSDAEHNRMKRLLGSCELSAAVSNQVRSFTVQRFSLDPRRVQTIPNGLDLSQFPKPVKSARESLGIANDDFVFINLSSYHGVKSHPLMLSAVQELVSTFPNIKLICAGNVADRPYFQRLEQRVLEEGLSRSVFLFDHLEKERIWQLLCSANCFLMPSLQEGWSMAVMEAMYAGLPLILSDIGSAREIIEDSDIGLIIPNSYQQIGELQWQDLAKIGNRDKPENLKHLVKAMSEIYLDRDNWRKRGVRGIEKIIGLYDISKMVAMYQQSYLEAIYAGFKRSTGD